MFFYLNQDQGLQSVFKTHLLWSGFPLPSQEVQIPLEEVFPHQNLHQPHIITPLSYTSSYCTLVIRPLFLHLLLSTVTGVQNLKTQWYLLRCKSNPRNSRPWAWVSESVTQLHFSVSSMTFWRYNMSHTHSPTHYNFPIS